MRAIWILLFTWGLARADAQEDDSEPPNFEKLNNGEREAAEALWDSFKDLKDVHKVRAFHSHP